MWTIMLPKHGPCDTFSAPERPLKNQHVRGVERFTSVNFGDCVGDIIAVWQERGFAPNLDVHDFAEEARVVEELRVIKELREYWGKAPMSNTELQPTGSTARAHRKHISFLQIL